MSHKVLSATWTTKDGDVLTLGEMSESHLRNATKMVERRRDHYRSEAMACASCLGLFQGEMAIYHAEQDLDRLSELEMDAQHTLDVMLEACRIRNIIV